MDCVPVRGLPAMRVRQLQSRSIPTATMLARRACLAHRCEVLRQSVA